MSYNEVVQMPYVLMLIQGADFPSVDYDSKKKTKNKPSNFGTKISDLPADVIAQMR